MQVSAEVQQTARQTIKFAAVGVTGVGVNFLVLTIAIYLFHLTDAVALGLGIIFSMSSNYVLNRIWTFHSEEQVIDEYIKYIVLNLIGVLIQYGVALALEKYFETINFISIYLLILSIPSIYIASTVGILLGFISNFIFSKYLVFS